VGCASGPRAGERLVSAEKSRLEAVKNEVLDQGTHWYHPHLHGSTALQTGGGAHGIIIVEDAASDGLPSW